VNSGVFVMLLGWSLCRSELH